MKLLYFDDFRLGVVAGDSVVDVTDLVSDIPHIDRGDLINGLIERFDDYRNKLEAAAANGGGVPIADVRIRPPVPKPTTIDCMAVNYMEDGTRDAPAQINAFHKSPGAVIGHNDTMILPDVPAAVFEGEAELAAIIGKPADNIGEADAMDHVFGWTCFIDGSARALPPPGNTFFQVKSRKTFAPIGPWDRDEGRNRRPSEPPGQTVEQRRFDAELQHRRHGAQDSALHLLAVLDPPAGAGRYRRHRDQPPRPPPVPARRPGWSWRSRASAGSPST